MKTSLPLVLVLSLAGWILLSCRQAVPVPEQPETGLPQLSLPGVARLLSELPLTRSQMEEVHDAVTASAANGYDDEYMMCDLFESPGAGVGSARSTRAEAIISYREANGKFEKCEDLMNVTGIKQGIYEKLKDEICTE